MIAISSGLAYYLMGDYGLRRCIYGGVIRVYSTPRPESADAAVPVDATEIARITNDGLPITHTDAGLRVEFRGLDTLVKDGEWILKGITHGIPIWWRWCMPNDPLNFSLMNVRIDGDVWGDLQLQIPSIIPTSRINIKECTIRIPQHG